MAIHTYECPKGHKDEVIESICDEHKRVCKKCSLPMKLSAAVTTAPPKFKRGGAGGFYKPDSE